MVNKEYHVYCSLNVRRNKLTEKKEHFLITRNIFWQKKRKLNTIKWLKRDNVIPLKGCK